MAQQRDNGGSSRDRRALLQSYGIFQLFLSIFGCGVNGGKVDFTGWGTFQVLARTRKTPIGPGVLFYTAGQRDVGAHQKEVHDVPGAAVHGKEALPMSRNPQQEL